MHKAGLAEPLLQKGTAQISPTGATELSVFRSKGSNVTVRTKEGDVRFQVHKRKSLFGGLDWHLVSARGQESSYLFVRRSLISGQATFTTHDDVVVATMTHEIGKLFSDLQWDAATYRWELTGSSVPALLRLVHTDTKQCVAQLQASSSLPWSKQQQHITVLIGQDDPMWLQVVVASGLAEAQRLGVVNSWTAPKRWAK